MDQDENQQKQSSTSSGSMILYLILFIVIYAIYSYFLVIPVYKHAARTGNGWSVFWAGWPFPFNWIGKSFELNPAFAKN